MVRKFNYKPYDIEIGFELEEGNITVDNETELDFGEGTSWKLQNKIKKGDYVALDTTRDRTVKKAGEDDTVIGEIIDTPRWKGARPTASATSGNYPKRIATVRLYGNYVHEVTVVESNAEINIGDSVEYKGNNTFDKTATVNNTRALAKKDALAQGTVPVLFGFYGI